VLLQQLQQEVKARHARLYGLAQEGQQQQQQQQHEGGRCCHSSRSTNVSRCGVWQRSKSLAE
jgi:hypothetical protein